MIKRIIYLILSMLLIFSYTACSNKQIAESDEGNSNSKIIVDNEKSGTKNLANQINNVLTAEEYKKKRIVEPEFNEELNTVKFGSYWQSDSTGNVKDVIEWYVVKKEEKKALLVSKSLLDCKAYNDVYDDNHHITWEESTIRQWLNDSFYNEAFTNEEKKNIVNTKVVNKDHYIGTRTIRGGNDTNDNVFLLSFDEAMPFTGVSVECSDYLLSHYQIDEFKKIWWLRSPGGYKSHAGSYSTNGFPYDDGNRVDEIGGIRPAIWVHY